MRSELALCVLACRGLYRAKMAVGGCCPRLKIAPCDSHGGLRPGSAQDNACRAMRTVNYLPFNTGAADMSTWKACTFEVKPEALWAVLLLLIGRIHKSTLPCHDIIIDLTLLRQILLRGSAHALQSKLRLKSCCLSVRCS